MRNVGLGDEGLDPLPRRVFLALGEEIEDIAVDDALEETLALGLGDPGWL